LAMPVNRTFGMRCTTRPTAMPMIPAPMIVAVYSPIVLSFLQGFQAVYEPAENSYNGRWFGHARKRNHGNRNLPAATSREVPEQPEAAVDSLPSGHRHGEGPRGDGRGEISRERLGRHVA